MAVDIETIKATLKQYGLVKGHEDIDEAVIDRVAKIVFKEFLVELKDPFQLDGGPIDLSAKKARMRPGRLKETPISGSSETALVEPESEDTAEPQELSEDDLADQIVDVVARPPTSAQPPPSAPRQVPPPQDPRAGGKPVEGQRAVSTPQQNHFKKHIEKVTAKIPDSAKRSGALPPDYEQAINETFEDPLDESIEVTEGGDDYVVDPQDTNVGELFEEGRAPEVANPKDALALQRSLPKKLGEVENQTKGNSKSIRRLE